MTQPAAHLDVKRPLFAAFASSSKVSSPTLIDVNRRPLRRAP